MSYYIGVMSGTSLDGVDIAIVDFDDRHSCNIIAAKTFPFTQALHNKLQHIISQVQCSLKDLGELDIALGRFIAQLINQFISEHHITANKILAIGSHGQTLYHEPNSDFPFSMQIGNASVISQLTNITTVADFRQADMAAQGQGAPLVPAFHNYLFSDPAQSRTIINIGGISNITFIPDHDDHQLIIGFDTGPGNVLLDSWIQRHQQKPYDEAGQWAEAGQCNDALLAQMLDDSYFKKTIPKSTGREHFNLAWIDSQLSSFDSTVAANDVQATLLQLTAQSITSDISRFCKQSQAVYICGGGAHNKALMTLLSSLVGERIIASTAEIGLQPDWVEAAAFAWLAKQTMTKQAGNLPSVTGAKYPVILGAVYSSRDAS